MRARDPGTLIEATAGETPRSSNSGATPAAWLRALAASEEFWPFAGLAAAVFLGLAIRLFYVVPADFPLNDGGLFYAMARDLREANYALPEFTSYNAESLPFAYPPLFIYVLALLDDLTPLSAFDVLLYLPLLINVATIPVFYVLARLLLPSKVGVIVAALVFATMQNGFEWHIMGGGITRAPALLFSLLAIVCAHRAYVLEGWKYPVLAALFASLALLSHPDLFVIVGVALLFVVYGRSRRGLRNTVVIAAGVALLTAPWWGSVIARHGLDTLLATGESRTEQGWTDSILPWRDFLTFPFTKQPLLNWPAVLAVLGAGAAIASAQFFLPLWLVAEVLAEPHQAPNFVHVPVALLIGVAAGSVIVPAWRWMTFVASTEDNGAADGESPPRSRRSGNVYRWLGLGVVAGYFFIVTLFSALNEPDQLDHLQPLEAEQRALMGWVEQNTPAGSPFLVVSGLPWWGDRTSEWFPALTGGHSLVTAQGAEWLGETFTARIDGHEELQTCGDETADCLGRVAREHNVEFEYVYIASSCCETLTESLRDSSEYRIEHEAEGGLIARHLTATGRAGR